MVPKFEKMAKYAENLCRAAISRQSTPIPAIFDHRAKDRISLKVKMRDKYHSKPDARAKCDTFQNARVALEIDDLAAMRIALYYPNQNLEVGKLIEEIFEVRKVDKPKKESGYIADHYVVRFKDNEPEDTAGKSRFKQEPEDMVEIQVVSVFFHTWAQVEHKVKYKRKAYPSLSDTEQRIIKGLRGLVTTGDLLLEELYDLQLKITRPFEDEYALGSWLCKNIPEHSLPRMGNHRGSDQIILFKFLNIFQLNTPDTLGDILKEIIPQKKTQESEVKLQAIIQKYALSQPRTSIILIDHIFRNLCKAKLDRACENIRYPTGKPHLDKLTYQCRTVLNALNWLHELFDEKKEKDQFAQVLEKYRNLGDSEASSVHWAYNGTARSFETTPPSASEPILKLWRWMEDAANCPALSLVFRLAQSGIWQESNDELIYQLYKRRPWYVISRESTDDVGEAEE
jgi:ppGpp synthetase/RelA/SpoT-type nucleotidyltranferase